jgi:membrane fusion protein (multidrug efflux system)
VICALFLAACGAEEAKKAAGPLEVSVVQVEPTDVTIFADFVGTVDGVENAEIRARVAGYLTEAHFREGSRVNKDDLLFTIDPVLTQAAVRQAAGDVAMAKANASKAKADVDRLTPLVATNAVSRQELDHAMASKQQSEAQILAAEGNMASAQASLGYTKVRSPITGIVGVRQVSLGSLVGQGEPTLLTTVSELDTVRVRFPISEQLYLKHAAKLNQLATGSTGERRLKLILADGSTYPELGWLALIDRAVSVTSGSILLEARFPNPKGILRPGQFARVRAATDKITGAIAVPQRSIIERQSMHEVFVLAAGDKVERRVVQVGEKVGSHWLINKGLKPGDKVLTEGLQKVRAGSVVKPELIPQGPVGAQPVTENTPDPAAAVEPPSAAAPAEAPAAAPAGKASPAAPASAR